MTFKDFKRITLKVHNYLLFFLIYSSSSSFFFFKSFCFRFSQHLNMKIKYWSTKYNCAVSSAFVQKEKKNDIIIKIFILMALLHT